jgi:Bacterial EndoU nuclease
VSELGRSGSDRPSEAHDSPVQSFGRNYALQPMTQRERELENKVYRGELRWRGDQWVESEPYEWVQRDEDRARGSQAETHPPGRAGDLPEARDAGPGIRTAEDASPRPSAWDSIDAADRPPLDDLHLTADRAEHILHGDRTGGGHLSGTGQPGKTEFPASWDDTKIMDAALDVARRPDRPPVQQDWNGRWVARGVRDDVDVVVVIAVDGRIWSSWPLPGGPGVVKNPKET